MTAKTVREEDAAVAAKTKKNAVECAAFSVLGSRFAGLTKVGSGSYGVVCSATDTQTLEKVAIKRVSPWADDARG